MAELRVAIGMIVPFLGLPIALEAVIEGAEEMGDRRMVDRMLALRRTIAASSATVGLPPAASRPRAGPRIRSLVALNVVRD